MIYVLYISDMDKTAGGLVSTFAGDTNICEVAEGEEDCERIQWDIDHVPIRANNVRWSLMWVNMRHFICKCEYKCKGVYMQLVARPLTAR